MQEHDQSFHFEQLILPHLDAAYNLARWLTQNDQDAQDMVQEACLRAYRFLPTFRGGNSRAWLLTIVRNTCSTWQHRKHSNDVFDEERHDRESEALDPEQIYLHEVDVEELNEAIKALPGELREILILHELEELSYKEISTMIHIPMGTAMSRLSHARKRLRHHLMQHAQEEETHEL